MKQYPVLSLSSLRIKLLQRGVVLGTILLVALLAFETFNYSTTQFALNDLLGPNLRFAGISWATILAIAFCGIDFAGLARLFTPELVQSELTETWYLIGAWFLAAAMNATLTWWGVAVAVRTHVPEASGTVLNREALLVVIPIFVALMVMLIRILIIGTFARAGSRIFTLAGEQWQSRSSTNDRPQPFRPSKQNPLAAHHERQVIPSSNPTVRPEPTYHPVGMSARPRSPEGAERK